MKLYSASLLWRQSLSLAFLPPCNGGGSRDVETFEMCVHNDELKISEPAVTEPEGEAITILEL